MEQNMAEFIMDRLGLSDIKYAKLLRRRLLKNFSGTFNGLALCPGVELDVSWDEFAEYSFDIPVGEYVSENQEMIDFFSSFRDDVGLCIFTNGSFYHARNSLLHLGIERFFPDENIFCVERMNTPGFDPAKMIEKPSREAFRIVIEGMGMDPDSKSNEMYFVDDSMRSVKASLENGFVGLFLDEREGENLMWDPSLKNDDEIEKLTQDGSLFVINHLLEIKEALPHLFE